MTMMTDIDYNLLFDLKPLPGDEVMAEELINTDKELDEINKELSDIAIDTIPFDKTDVMVIFASAMFEVAADFLLSDSTNPNSFASKCNDSKNPIGKWMNNIHENINHKNNPLDNQGAFNANNEFFGYGTPKHDENVISFSGGDHRERTYGHDLFRFWSAIRQLHDGEFRDAGYIGEELIKVASTVNQYGTKYAKLGWGEAVWEYVCHMFADFFSSKGLPCPGWSWLSHADNREIRKAAADLYRDGMNLRTELLKGVTVAVPEIIIRIVQFLRYRNSEYSKEAREKKQHLMLLMTHGIATAVNVGKVVLSENPAALNLPMIVRTLKLAWSCIKDEQNFKHRVTEKLNLDLYKQQLEFKKTVIVTLRGIYYTTQYQILTIQLQEEYKRRVQQRIVQALHLSNLHMEYDLQKMIHDELLSENNSEIIRLSEKIEGEYNNEELKVLLQTIPRYEGSLQEAINLYSEVYEQ